MTTNDRRSEVSRQDEDDEAKSSSTVESAPGNRAAAHLLHAGAIALVTFAAYRSSLPFELLGDAEMLITQNEELRDWSNFGRMFTADFFGSSVLGPIGYWRPLTKVSWFLEYRAGNGSPTVFNAIQVLWVVATALATRALALALGVGPRAATASALCVSLAPAMVEPGCLVMARSDLSQRASPRRSRPGCVGRTPGGVDTSLLTWPRAASRWPARKAQSSSLR